MIAGPMLCLLGMLAAGSAWAQAPVERDTAAGTKPVKAPAPVERDTAPGTKPITAQAPVERDTAAGTKSIKAPAKPAAKTASKKPGKASRAAAKPKKASRPPAGTKAKPAPAKRAGKAKSRSGKPVAAKKPVAAAGPDASKAAPGTPAAAPGQPAGPPLLGKREAEARYHEGVELERRGDLRAAFKAYSQAGESGNGPAQKKLGDLYGTGNEVVERDYETSLRWYDRARAQGIEIRKPFTYPGVRR